jgi:hypothetical protein
MANSYKILIDNSTLGAIGTVVTEDDIIAAPLDVELLVASGIVESVTKTKNTEKD